MTYPGFIRRVAAALLFAAVAAPLHAVPIVPAVGESGLAWSALTPAQQQALAPLQRDWATIDAPRREKWIEIAARFPRMPGDERARVQRRMADWARMTPSQRAQARLQYQQVRQLSSEERQARWQAYQALSDEERRALTLSAKPGTRPAPAAEAVARPRPVIAGASAPAVGAKRNLVTTAATPVTRTIAPTVVQAKPGATTTTMSTRAAPPPHHQAGLPKVAATPGFVDPTTLLPQRGPQGAAVRGAPPADSAADPIHQP